MKRNGAILDLFRKHEEKARKIATEHHTEDIENVRCPNSPPPIHSDTDMDTDTEIDVEIEDATPSLPSPQQPSAHVFSGDPGKRTPILEYAFNDQDSVQRRYIPKTACRPYAPAFQVRKIYGKNRHFSFVWFEKYSWLEYSVSKEAAYCFVCYLFKGKTNGGPRGDAFV